MNITELLTKTLKTNIEYICLNITTAIDLYPLCFIDYEDQEKLAVYITGEDGRERYMIIYKTQIIAIQVVYEQDINITNETKEDIMIQ